MQQDNPTPATTESSVDTPKHESGWRRGWRGIMVMGHAAIAIGLIAGLVMVLQQRADAVSPIASLPAVSVDTAIARQESGYETTHRFTGRIEAVRQTSVSAELGGKVNKILVREGQRVNSGDVIARLDTRSLRAQRAEQAARRRTLEKDRELAEL
ncbi:MAG: biotin/lipoyl-binding protein, partial [Burkholderiaceae bacterium]